MAEWSKGLVLGTSRFAGVGSSLSSVILLTFRFKVLLQVFLTPAHGILTELPKALVISTSLFVGAGSIPPPVILLTFLYKVFLQVFLTGAHGIFYDHP